MSAKDYQYLREHRPDLLRQCAEVGHCVTCAPPQDDRLSMGASAEQRAVEIVASLLREGERIRALCNDPEPIEVRVLAAQLDGDQRVVAMMRERDEALADLDKEREVCRVLSEIAADTVRTREEARAEAAAAHLAYVEADAEVERLRAEVARLTAGWAADDATLRAAGDDLIRAIDERDEAWAEVARLKARRRKLADLKAHARKLELHLQSLADEVLDPVGHDDAVKALARGALRYLDAAPDLPEVDDG